ncbi:MAG TPA: glycosyltransferase family 1 protein [Ilumatobacteraceae bacterium]|nr:glycosyltransferase family 1 protein [Ilumatobacteraceae bacterium]HRB04215.1 glycosyltransferase family 1 protein [Ilumatobacteraceae bacterium]
MRVAYTLEQCWHRIPGGTGVAALRIAEALGPHNDVRLVGVAGRHRHLPPDPWAPTIPVAHLPIAAPLLYESWLYGGWPNVEMATGRVDIAHATTLIPCPTKAKLVVTLHDLAFLYDPSQFTRHGVRVFRRSLDIIKRRADLVLCCSQATMDDCVAAGIDGERLRLVPLGVEAERADDAEVARVRQRYGLPDDYLLFVGTVEPRKNLKGLVAALAHLPEPPLLVVAGADGWGDIGVSESDRVRFLGFVASDDLSGLYGGASVFCYPSEREGYGLPVLEAMAQGTPVVTSRGTATEETAGDAAVLVDPRDPHDIARGVDEALRRHSELAAKGLARVQRRSWATSASLTAAAYRELAG